MFGSRAKNENLEISDYDIIIISDDFKNIKWHRLIEEISIFWDLKQNLDVLPYTSEEFEEKLKGINIIKSAMEYAKEINI